MATINGTSGNDTLNGTAAADSISGGNGSDVLIGNDGNDSLYGGGANDTLRGGAGADQNFGGTGTDQADYSDSGAGVNVNLTTNAGSGGTAQGDTYNSIENVSGSDFGDTLTGNTGNNALWGGVGDDQLYGGAGVDSLYGGDGADTLVGGAGGDLLNGGAGIDTADYSASTSGVTVNLATGSGTGGDAASDTLTGVENLIGSGYADTLTGDAGANYLYGGAGNDSLSSGDGDDTLAGGAGADTLTGGQGMDFIDYSASGAAVSVNLNTWTALYGDAQGDVLTGVDGIIGTSFNDTLIGFNDQGLVGDVYTNVFYGAGGSDYIDGMGSNDQLFGGADNDTILGGDGDDLTDGGDGNDSLFGGAGADTLGGGAGNDTAYGGDGNDLAYGGDGADLIYGDAGNDSLFGGTGTDTLFGGVGNDVLGGGDGADALYGGDGNDTLQGGAGDTLDGGTGNDVLDLTGQAPFHIIRDPSNPLNGTVEFYDVTGHVIGTLSYTNMESIVSCYTPGTMIATPRGAVAVEALQKGDLVVTRDNGVQPVRWIGCRRVAAGELAAEPRLGPVRIAQGALGAGLPERDMLVSRQHRMLLCGPAAELMFGAHEVLVRALHLVCLPGITLADVAEVSYLHLLFDQHEIILADGAWSESFQPGDRTMAGLDDDQRLELDQIFPEWRGRGLTFDAARMTLRSHEVRLLLALRASRPGQIAMGGAALPLPEGVVPRRRKARRKARYATPLALPQGAQGAAVAEAFA